MLGESDFIGESWCFVALARATGLPRIHPTSLTGETFMLSPPMLLPVVATDLDVSGPVAFCDKGASSFPNILNLRCPTSEGTEGACPQIQTVLGDVSHPKTASLSMSMMLSLMPPPRPALSHQTLQACPVLWAGMSLGMFPWGLKGQQGLEPPRHEESP